MFKTSSRIIFSGLFSMVAAPVLLYFDTLVMLAYILLVYGFFAIGIGILLGFHKMITEEDR